MIPGRGDEVIDDWLGGSRMRTASVTSAQMLAKARAVSIPIPEAPPVMTKRFPVKSIPSTTSAAVEENPEPRYDRAHDDPFQLLPVRFCD